MAPWTAGALCLSASRSSDTTAQRSVPPCLPTQRRRTPTPPSGVCGPAARSSSGPPETARSEPWIGGGCRYLHHVRPVTGLMMGKLGRGIWSLMNWWHNGRVRCGALSRPLPLLQLQCPPRGSLVVKVLLIWMVKSAGLCISCPPHDQPVPRLAGIASDHIQRLPRTRCAAGTLQLSSQVELSADTANSSTCADSI